jgi:hypothetical protein
MVRATHFSPNFSKTRDLMEVHRSIHFRIFDGSTTSVWRYSGGEKRVICLSGSVPNETLGQSHHHVEMPYPRLLHP